MRDDFNIRIMNKAPIITDKDIKNRFVVRYFLTKANQINEIVFEVDQRQYDRLIDKRYIVGGYLNWVIVGPLEDYTISVNTGAPPDGFEEIIIPGVLTQNKGAITFLSRKIPILSNTVTVYDQFYVGE